jgi:hypothetical protein
MAAKVRAGQGAPRQRTRGAAPLAPVSKGSAVLTRRAQSADA